VDFHREHRDGYVGSDACRTCHPYQHAAWDASYHSTMTQLATPKAVRAPFDGGKLQLEGVTWRPERRGDEFWVEGSAPGTAAGDTARLERRVVLTTGSHNYQMYWLEGDGPRSMQPFPLVYLIRDGVWIPRKSRFLSPHVEQTPPEAGRWNLHCIKCHATRGRPLPPPDETTTVAQIGIACEACHGPGAEHVHANRMPLRRFLLYATGRPDPTIVNPARLPHDRSTEVCAQCHSIEVLPTPEQVDSWQHEGSRFRPGDDLSKYQTIVHGRLQDNPPAVQEYVSNHAVFRLRYCFWPDGMLRITGREYHGMLESPCYQRGDMSCLSCHRMHRAKDDPRPFPVWADDELSPGMRGDAACVQCHAAYGKPEALAAHTHHPAASEGSRCLNCHMSYTTWGLLRGIRSHTVSSPDVSVTVATGRPNACNQCHLDRTLEWTAQNLEAWYKIPPPELSEDQRTVAASVLWTLSGDAVQRALMAWSMGWGPAREASGTAWMPPYLGVLLTDSYDAVRYNAQRSLRRFPEFAAVTADSVAGATPEQQFHMMGVVLDAWFAGFPGIEGSRGRDLLFLPDGKLDKAHWQRLASMRNEETFLLFE